MAEPVICFTGAAAVREKLLVGTAFPCAPFKNPQKSPAFRSLSTRSGGGRNSLSSFGGRTAAATSSPASSVTEEDDCEVVTGTDVVIKIAHDDGGELLVPEVVNAADVDSLDEEGLVAHLVQPMKNRNGSGVLLLSDVRGYKDKETRDFGYRLACYGYSVLIPDLFHGNPWDPTFAIGDYEDWRASHPDARVAADVDAAALFLRSHLSPPAVPGLGRIAVLGFCFGGGRVIEALARDGQRMTASPASPSPSSSSSVSGSSISSPVLINEPLFSAAVFFYGTRFDPTIADDIRVPLLLITGDSDPLCPMESVQEVARRAGRAGKNDVVTRVYVGKAHAFAHKPSSAEEDEDAEDAFKAARQWLHDRLLEGAPEWLEPVVALGQP